ncbi:MAG: DUF6758 family protein [Marmoricola sp.]
MPLAASCPRCTSPVTGEGVSFACSVHGPIEPLWRPAEADYDSFAELVGRSDQLPTYLPWPMSPGWSIADFGCVGNAGQVRATVTTTVGTSDLDGEVEVTIVSEEPGIGLGARCAGTTYDDPGPQISNGPPAIHVRAGGRTVPLWLVDDAHDDAPHDPRDETPAMPGDEAADAPADVPAETPGEAAGGASRGRSGGLLGDDDLLARAVFAGEADGRWLWLVMKPASAALLLHDDWLLADVTGFGPEALEMPFGGPRPAW